MHCKLILMIAIQIVLRMVRIVLMELVATIAYAYRDNLTVIINMPLSIIILIINIAPSINAINMLLPINLKVIINMLLSLVIKLINMLLSITIQRESLVNDSSNYNSY